MFGLGVGEMVLIGVVALLFIGPKKIPELAKGMGKGIRDFQKAIKGDEDGGENTAQKETKKVEYKDNQNSNS
jgi:sec-independent protein translocase protein TatA